MKSIDRVARSTNKNTHGKPRRFKTIILVSALLMLGTAMAVPFDSVDSSSRKNTAIEGLVQQGINASDANTKGTLQGWASMLSLPSMAGESVTLYAADCVTPRSAFNLGEVVCAKTDGVDLSVPNNHYMNWIDSQLNSTNGGSITQNPQFFLFTPPTEDTWKATIGRLVPADSSIVGNPPLFTVSLGIGVATYAQDCTTPKTTFTLGDIVCAKVSGNDPSFNRRFGWVDPSGITRTFTPITTDPQTDSFTLPNTETSTIDVFVVDNRGQWKVNVVSSRGSIVRGQPFLVQGNTPTADLSISKSLVGDNPESGESLTFAVAVTNTGPNPAQNVQISDAEPDNASFVSVTQTSGPAFSCIGSNPVVCTRGTTASPLFLNPGETAVFEFVYTATGSAGSSITNTATVGSDTTELNEVDNTAVYTVIIGGGGGTPAECVLNCPPSLTVATNTTTQNGDPAAIVTFGEAVANGNCGTVTASPASGSVFPVGTTVVTVSSSVGGGTCSFAVTVIDSPAPTITCPANQTVQAPSGETEVTIDVGTPNATGSNVVIGSSRSDERPVTDPYPIGTTTITWSATDEFGRVATCVQTIVVTSTDTPTISCPSNKTFTSLNGCSYTATAGEIGAPTTTGPNVTVTSERSDGLALTDPFPRGDTFIEWTATNNVGSASCTQKITVIGNATTPPTLSVPPNVTVSTNSCGQIVGESQLGTASASDDCGPVNVTRTGVPPGNFFPTGTTTITYSATNSAGTTTGTQTVTVLEDPAIPPTITAPGDVTAYTGPGATSCGTLVSDATLGTASASDNCGSVVVTRTGVPAGNIFPVGNTTVTYTATDASGNTATDTQVVTVIDNTPPVISCPASITLEPSCPTGAIATWTAPTGTDNCPGATTGQTAGPASGSVFPIGTTTVTYTVNDVHGNSASCSFTVTVLTPQAVIQNLINEVNASSLTGTQKNGLLAKLNAALSAINTGQQNVACNKLSEFINSVGVLINNGSLTAAQGNAWISSANHVRNTIGCTNLPCS
jgi:uncharacterized repeat protein (TIGR01451 family)